MASQADHYSHLARVGREGFALLEELDLTRRPKKIGNRHQQPPQPHDSHHYDNYHYEHRQPAAYIYRGPQINRHQQPPQPHDSHHYDNYHYEHHQPAAYIYRGPQIITVLEEPVIDCNQAAQRYGGTVVVDHSRRKPIPNGGY